MRHDSGYPPMAEGITEVVCAACHRAFTSGICSPTQATGCAADIRAGVIMGHWGSVYDMHQYQRKPDTLVPVDADPVCDACISRWLDGGMIEDLGENPWYLEENPW